LISEANQKIFKARYKTVDCAWAITGVVYNADKTFDLVNETAKAIDTFASAKFTPVEGCMYDAAKRINDSIKNAHVDGRLDNYPSNPDSSDKNTIARVFLVGYFRKHRPSLIVMRFFHDAQVLSEPFVTNETPPENDQYVGSYEIARRYCQGTADAVFGKYFRPSGVSLAEGLAHATGFIQACKDPLGVEVDPNCKNIGGHIHAAAVTPSGFTWLIEPRTT
jgi:hypothetical protein